MVIYANYGLIKAQLRSIRGNYVHLMWIKTKYGLIKAQLRPTRDNYVQLMIINPNLG